MARAGGPSAKAYAAGIIASTPTPFTPPQIIARSCQPLYFGTCLGYIVTRTVTNEGTSLQIICMDGEHLTVTLAHNIHENEQAKIDMLSNVGKLIAELQAFAQAVENLEGEE